jgi:hypothetical protein
MRLKGWLLFKLYGLFYGFLDNIILLGYILDYKILPTVIIIIFIIIITVGSIKL